MRSRARQIQRTFQAYDRTKRPSAHNAERAKRAKEGIRAFMAKRVELYAFYVDLGLTIDEARDMIDAGNPTGS